MIRIENKIELLPEVNGIYYLHTNIIINNLVKGLINGIEGGILEVAPIEENSLVILLGRVVMEEGLVKIRDFSCDCISFTSQQVKNYIKNSNEVKLLKRGFLITIR